MGQFVMTMTMPVTMKSDMEFDNSVFRVFIHILSIFLNGAIIRVVVQKTLFKCPSNRFVLSLAASHVLFSLLTLLVSLTSFIDTFSLHVLTEQVNVYNFIFFGAAIHNSLLLTSISCERYITIAKPMRYKSILTTQRISLIILFLWISSTLLTIIPLVLPYQQNGSGQEESLLISTASYFAIVFTITTVLCLSVMSVCYYIIFTIAKEKCQHVQIGQFTSSISSDWPSSIVCPSQEGQKSSSLLQHVLKANIRHANSFRLQKMEEIRKRRPIQNSPRKTIATIFAILGSLVITQLPVSFTLYDIRLWNWASLMLMLSSISNPILYGLLNRKIRVELWKTLRIYKRPKRPECWCRQQPSICSDIMREMIKETNHNHIHHSHSQHQHSHLVHSHSCSNVHVHDRELLPGGLTTASNMVDMDRVTCPSKLQCNTNVDLDTDIRIRIRIDGPDKAQESEKQEYEKKRDEDVTQLSDSIQFPRKDSQDSGADMTFSDEEEEGVVAEEEEEAEEVCVGNTPTPTSTPSNVFTVQKTDTDDEDEDQRPNQNQTQV